MILHRCKTTGGLLLSERFCATGSLSSRTKDDKNDRDNSVIKRYRAIEVEGPVSAIHHLFCTSAKRLQIIRKIFSQKLQNVFKKNAVGISSEHQLQRASTSHGQGL